MNVQNAKELTITEGDVRTIHDSGGTQLWGRVAYDTKYAGDATQSTTPTPESPQAINVVQGTQTITLTDGVVSDSFTVNLGENLFNVNTITKGKILDGSGNLFTASDWSTSDFITVESSTQYTLSRHATSSGQYAYLCKYKADGTHIERIYLAPDTTTYTFTTDSDCAKVRISDVTVNINTVQLNIGTSVVPVIELAKIGTYQDYIYKSGGNWYVHKAIKKITLNGTENWTKPQDDYVYRLDGDYSDMVGASIDNAGISDYFVYWANTGGILNNLPNGQFGFVGTLTSINFRNDSTTTSTAFKTWLQSNNTTVYYALATPTDTLVTDATLISQLEAIHEWLTRYGYQSSVVGSLPIIISQTNL